MATPNQPPATSPDENSALRIVKHLDVNFFVEAGAGTGKTHALVSRVVALVKAGPDLGGATMERIVAITFTEAAAAELSERIRSRMEQLLDPDHPENAGDPLFPLTADEEARVRTAIDELDQSTIQTIHSFAGQLLRERPMDVGLPPGWLQLDDLAATQRFNQQWERWLEWALGDNTGAPQWLQGTLRDFAQGDVGLRRWAEFARGVTNWYGHLHGADSIPWQDVPCLARQALEELEALAALCDEPSDLLYRQLDGAIRTVRAILNAGDDLAGARQAFEASDAIDFSGSVGTRRNWQEDPRAVREQFRAAGSSLRAALRAVTLLELLEHLRQEFAINFEAQRKRDGVATFDDLLVWGRDLLLNDDARAHFQHRYSHLLIDEFQDTDPLQAEIAFYLASIPGTDVRAQPWHSLPLAPGRLFLVGDSKQSIYRFRGADFSVTSKVKAGGQLHELTLTENRRSQRPVLDWVNAAFSQLMERDDAELRVQADYSELVPHAAIQQCGHGSVTAFGDFVDTDTGTLRQLRARHIASLIAAHARNGPQPLEVYDKSTRTLRPADLGDFCILIRTRSGLGSLQWELENANIPYRAEGNSLLFETQEVQDLLNCLQAIDDPTNEVAVAAALRSPAFACSDVDLLRWKEAGGPWDYLSPGLEVRAHESLSDRQHPMHEVTSVRAAMAALRAHHLRRQYLAVSQLISEFVRERRLEELDLAEYRTREIWRRRQFLVEQARAFEAEGPDHARQTTWNLHQFIVWAENQRSERSRVRESPAPDTDDDAVRIMTIHAAKGLEFPIVIVPDLRLAAARRPDGPILVDSATGKLEASARRRAPAIETPGYETAIATEALHADAERIRLAYVAATRARDHLLVSVYHSAQLEPEEDEDTPETGADSTHMPHSDAAAQIGLPAGLPHTHASPDAGLPTRYAPAQGEAVQPYPRHYDPQAWREQRVEAIYRRSQQQAVTATWLAGRDAAGSDALLTGVQPRWYPDIDDKEAEPDAEQPWRTGRGATAFGRAVHAAMQDMVNLISQRRTTHPEADLTELLSDLGPRIGECAQIHAGAEGVPNRQDEVVELVQRGLSNPTVLAALRSPRRWTEIPVAAPVETERGPVVVQGIIDLLYEDDDGSLVVVDYKSDAVSNESEAQSRMAHYKHQGAAYAAALQRATGKTVAAVRFIFLRIDAVQTLDDLPLLISELPRLIANQPD